MKFTLALLVRVSFRYSSLDPGAGAPQGPKTRSSVPAMTAIRSLSSASHEDINFTMPSSYTLATLPVPDSDAVRFVEVAPHRQIVLQFSGRGTPARLAAKESALRTIAQTAGVTLGDGPYYYFYDDPMTLPWNRRNEVAFRID